MPKKRKTSTNSRKISKDVKKPKEKTPKVQKVQFDEHKENAKRLEIYHRIEEILNKYNIQEPRFGIGFVTKSKNNVTKRVPDIKIYGNAPNTVVQKLIRDIEEKIHVTIEKSATEISNTDDSFVISFIGIIEKDFDYY